MNKDEEALNLLSEQNSVVSYVLSKCRLSSQPQKGSSYIVSTGEFLVVPDDHKELFNDIQDSIGIYKDDATAQLKQAGWIRCNAALGDVSYIGLSPRVPTFEQYDAIENFADMVLTRDRALTVYSDFGVSSFQSETFTNVVAGFQVVKSIKKLYSSGKFIPSSAFEALIKKARNFNTRTNKAKNS